MSNSDTNKATWTPDFSNGGENSSAPQSRPGVILSKLRDSIAWPIVALDYKSVGRGIAEHDKISVRVHAGMQKLTGEPVVHDGKLHRITRANGAIEFELRFAQELPKHIQPFALYVGRVDLWSFEPVSLGGIADQVTRSPSSGEVKTTADYTLAAAGLRRASSERIEIDWDDATLRVTVDRPPLRYGQPIMVETQFVDDRNDLRTLRHSLSIDDFVASGTRAGWTRGFMESRIPELFGGKYKITARPLQPIELDLLSSEQLKDLFAGQQMSAIVSQEDGHFIAHSDQQRRCLADVATNWYLRVSCKEPG